MCLWCVHYARIILICKDEDTNCHYLWGTFFSAFILIFYSLVLSCGWNSQCYCFLHLFVFWLKPDDCQLRTEIWMMLSVEAFSFVGLQWHRMWSSFLWMMKAFLRSHTCCTTRNIRYRALHKRFYWLFIYKTLWWHHVLLVILDAFF